MVPETKTVGPGGGPPCDFSGIQAAIDCANSGDTIRISNQQNWTVNPGLVVANKSLTIVGGFSDCADTTSDSTPSIINGAGLDTT